MKHMYEERIVLLTLIFIFLLSFLSMLILIDFFLAFPEYKALFSNSCKKKSLYTTQIMYIILIMFNALYLVI